MSKKNPKKADESASSFDPKHAQASADTAIAVLTEMGDRAGILIDAWIALGNAAAVDAASRSETLAPALRKAARRGLAVLKSRGASIPERTTTARMTIEDEPTWQAWFLPPDPSGVSTITIGTRVVGANWNVADVRIHEGAGIVEVSTGEVPGGAIRTSFRSSRARRGLEPTSVPLEWARWRIAQARETNARSGFIMPLGIDNAASLITPAPETAPAHPIDAAELVAPEAEIETRAKESASLHNEPEFAPWLPDIQVVNQMLALLGQKLGPDPDKATNEIVSNAMEEEITAATDRFFTPEVRQALAVRMKDNAISVLARAGRDRAIDVLATAEAMKRAGLITSPPSDIPFLRAFFQKAVAVLASQNGGKLNIPMAKPSQQPQALTPVVPVPGQAAPAPAPEPAPADAPAEPAP